MSEPGAPDVTDMVKTVTISEQEYDDLIQNSVLLNCLHFHGVDNWDGYDLALDDFHQLCDEEWQ